MHADARGGFSSGGGRGGFSSGGARATYSAPRPAAPSFSAPARPPVMTSPARPSTVTPPPRVSTTTTTTTTRSSSAVRGSTYGPGVAYGGFGMGYGYSNGMLTGLLIGNMLHPHGTVVYSGGGYNGNALLYPDGRVVNGQGVHVGNYVNGTYVPVTGGAVVAQSIPNPQPAQPVIVRDNTAEIIGVCILVFAIVILFIILL